MHFIKTSIIMLSLAVFMFCSGCATAKGLQEDAKGVVNGAKHVCKGIKKADEWVKDNLW